MLRSKFPTFTTTAYTSIITANKHKIIPNLHHRVIHRQTRMLCGQTRYEMSLLKKQNMNAYYRLCRLHQPIGAWLLYWPTAWGVCLGSAGVADPYLLLLFLMGSWTSRSADRDFDKKVQRTKSRPLASGQVTTKQAATLLFLNLCGGLIVLFHLNPTALLTTFGFVALGGLYPLAKRYTDYPQFVLGMGFNSGIIIGSLAINPQLVSSVIPIYLSGIAWTMIYDTVYAYQDIDDDLKIGVKSTAVTWRDKNPIQIMEQFAYFMLACHICLPLFDADFMISAPFMLLGDAMLLKQIQKLDLKDKQECSNFFKKNNLYGGLVFLGLLLMGLVKGYRQYCKQNAERKKNKK